VVLAFDLRPPLQGKDSLTDFLAPTLDLFRAQTLARIEKLSSKK
jgi:hypothetical protein